MLPEKESPNAGIVVVVYNWLMLIAGNVGTVIVFPVEQVPGTTIVKTKLNARGLTNG